MNNLDKQYTDLIGDAYKNYLKKSESQFISNEDGTMTVTSPSSHYNFLTKEEFINKIKTDNEFAKTWGVKVEIRELRRRERSIYYYLHILNEWYNGRNLPKRAISITYNNQTIEIYE